MESEARIFSPVGTTGYIDVSSRPYQDKVLQRFVNALPGLEHVGVNGIYARLVVGFLVKWRKFVNNIVRYRRIYTKKRIGKWGSNETVRLVAKYESCGC